MTRWWTYAVLAIAIVAGSIRVQASPLARERCELRESASVPASAARKRNGKPAQITRREASGASPLVIPDRIDLPQPPRAYTIVAPSVCEGHAATRPVRACSRAPPHD